MAAYGAMVSLLGVLDTILHPPRKQFYYNKIQLNSLHEKVSFLIHFLEKSQKTLETLEMKIRDAAYKAEDILESRMSKQLPEEPETTNYAEKFSTSELYWAIYIVVFIVIQTPIHVGIRKLFTLSIQIFMSVIHVRPFLIQAFLPVYFRNGIFVVSRILVPFTVRILTPVFILIYISTLITIFIYEAVGSVISYAARYRESDTQNLQQVIKEIESIANEVTRIEDVSGGAGQDILHQRTLSKCDSDATVTNVVVGFDSDLVKIKAQLSCGSSELEIVPIVGMGGIGKTTLARQVYDDSYIINHFDTRAWVTVSQEYSLKEVLIGLLDSAKLLTEEMYDMKANKLVLRLHKSLFNVKYLIVVDDMWDTKIWDSVRTSFPENNNGCRVLLTTRLSGVALDATTSSSPLHQMHFLNQDDSWKLLCNKVFRGKDCPDELKQTGKEIARNCEGLPLAIAVIGGLLSKAPRTDKYWTSVKDNLISVVTKDNKRCMEILSLSYNHLPHRLRACFLYMGVFPEDYEIPVSKLIRLWVAEGFLKPYESKSLEDLAADYLKDLIERNLVLVCNRSFNGKIKTCKIHDLLRNLCISNAHKENFLYVVNCDGEVLQGGRNDPRRLSINPSFLGVQTDRLYESDGIHNLTAHSLLCTGVRLIYPSRVYLAYKLLRVLDLIIVRFFHFPDEIIELVNLRYLAFTYNELLPSSISKLWNLQTIVLHNWSYGYCPSLPVEIWFMSNLRHIIITPSFLPHENLMNGPVLENLHTLFEVRNFKCGYDILKRIPNVKHLGISYDVSPAEVWSEYHLENLINLHQLETLKLVFTKNHSRFHTSEIPHQPNLTLPHSLTRLTLTGCKIPWESMTTIGALPNLEVLKLKKNGCLGEKWDPEEDEFGQLEYLLLEELDLVQWTAGDSHFPRLKRLVIRSCYRLKEICDSIGEMASLDTIELVDCHHSAVVSVREIGEEQWGDENDNRKVVVDKRRRVNNKFYSRVLH